MFSWEYLLIEVIRVENAVTVGENTVIQYLSIKQSTAVIRQCYSS